MLIAVNYHYIRPHFNYKYPGIYGLTPEQFEKQLVTLSYTGKFVSATDVLRAIDGRAELPEQAILITFDDGLKEQYELALPILDKLGIPAMLYVNTQNIAEKKISLVAKIHLLLTSMPFEEYKNNILLQARKQFDKGTELVDKAKATAHYNYDTEERAMVKAFLNFVLNFDEQSQIIGKLFEEVFPGKEEKICNDLYLNDKEVKDLHKRGYLGSHSHRHIPLGLYAKEEIEKDIRASYDVLKHITGEAPFSISYPYGSYDASGLNVQEIAKKAGFRFGFTMERAGNINFANPLGLSRFDCNDVPGGKSAMVNDASFFGRIPVSAWFEKKEKIL
jgi:peptidoglycan/xylan/chitin deacetylase (PgdA/CDA1 family)